MFNLCYLVVCMTLHQCREYRNSLGSVLPNSAAGTNIFYWHNPEDLTPDETIEHSLTSLIEDNPQLRHWKIVDSEAGNWLPWYHYADNTQQCDALVRLDNGFQFRDNIDNFEQFFTGLSILSIAKGDVLLNLEEDCADVDRLGVDSANILVDMGTMQDLLSLFQQHSEDQGMEIYGAGVFARWLAPYAITQTYTMKSKDLTYCADYVTAAGVDTSPIPEAKNFIRLARPLDVHGTEHQVNARVGAGAGGGQVVFF